MTQMLQLCYREIPVCRVSSLEWKRALCESDVIRCKGDGKPAGSVIAWPWNAGGGCNLEASAVLVEEHFDTHYRLHNCAYSILSSLS